MIYGGPLGAYLSGVYQPGSAASPRSPTSYSSSTSGIHHQPYSSSSPYSSSAPTASSSSAASSLRRAASSRRPNVGSSLPSSSSYDRVLGSGSSTSGLSSSYSTPTAVSKQLSPSTAAGSGSGLSNSNSSGGIGGSIYLTPQLGRRSYLSPTSDNPILSSNSSSAYVPNSSASLSRYRPGSFKGTTSIENGSNLTSSTVNDSMYGSGSRSSRTKPPTSTSRHQSSASPLSYSSLTSSTSSYTPVSSLPPPIYTSTAKLSPMHQYSSAPSSTTVTKPTFGGSAKLTITPSNPLCTDYKKLYDQEKENNNLLRGQIEKVQQEITENREAIHEMRRLRRRESENRRLDKKLADMEESEEILKKLREENEKLKAENQALDKAVENLRTT